MTIHFIEATQVTGLSNAAYATVSAPSGVPNGATGVFGYVINANAAFTTGRRWGARHPSDTGYTTNLNMRGANKRVLFVAGLNSSKQFDFYVESTTDQSVYVTGYFDSNAVFKTTAETVTGLTKGGTLDSDVDLTSYTAADATAVIYAVENATGGRAHMVRHASDTADTYNDKALLLTHGICPMASGQLVDVQLEDSSANLIVLGYLTDGVVDTGAVQVDSGLSAATWGSITNATTGATVALCALTHATNDANTQVDWGVRKDSGDTSWGFPEEGGSLAMAMIELDSAADFEAYLSTVSGNFEIWLLATFQNNGQVFINDAASRDGGEVLQTYPGNANWADGQIDMQNVIDTTGLSGQLYVGVQNADGAIGWRAITTSNEWTGSGTLSAPAADITSAGEVAKVGTGTPTAPAADISCVGTVTALTRSVQTNMVNLANVAQASLTGLTVLVWETNPPATSVAPDYFLTNQTTDVNGDTNWVLTGSELNNGDPIWVVVMKDGATPIGTCRKLTVTAT